MLSRAWISAERATDAGLKDLARPDSCLKALAELDLYDNPVTDAGVKELAEPNTGLKSLTILGLEATQ